MTLTRVQAGLIATIEAKGYVEVVFTVSGKIHDGRRQRNAARGLQMAGLVTIQTIGSRHVEYRDRRFECVTWRLTRAK